MTAILGFIDPKKCQSRSDSWHRSRWLQGQNKTCFYCGKWFDHKAKHHYEKPTVDHYVPLAKGGRDIPKNWRVACWHCNNEKGNRTHAEWNEEKRQAARLNITVVALRNRAKA